jgi:hypothetical protein
MYFGLVNAYGTYIQPSTTMDEGGPTIDTSSRWSEGTKACDLV